MPLADRVVHRLDDVMGGGVQGWRNMRQLVKHGQVVERRIAPLVLQVAQVGRPRHGHEDRAVPTQLYGLLGIAGVQGDVAGNRRDQLAHHAAIQVDAIAVPYLGAGLAPVLHRNRVAEDDADFLQDLEGGLVYPLDLFLRHGLDQRQATLQAGQHLRRGLAAQVAPRVATASPCC